MNFLIDECLHRSLVGVSVQRGNQATHVNFRGLGGVQDWNLMTPIREGAFTFVTNNAKDFRRLHAREALHAGLVIILLNARPGLQRILFDAVLDEFGDGAGLINEALEVGLVDGEIEIPRRVRGSIMAFLNPVSGHLHHCNEANPECQSDKEKASRNGEATAAIHRWRQPNRQNQTCNNGDVKGAGNPRGLVRRIVLNRENSPP